MKTYKPKLRKKGHLLLRLTLTANPNIYLFTDILHLTLKDIVIVEHEAGHDVDGDWEHNGAVIFCRNTVQCLEISKLHEKKIFYTLSVEKYFMQHHFFNLFDRLSCL